jgi:hypothetical protein
MMTRQLVYATAYSATSGPRTSDSPSSCTCLPISRPRTAPRKFQNPRILWRKAALDVTLYYILHVHSLRVYAQ